MASEVIELREQRVGLKGQAEAIIKEATDADRPLFDEETSQVNSLMDQAKAIVEKISEIEADAARARLSELVDNLDTPLPRKPSASYPTHAQIRDRDLEASHGFRHMGEFAMAVMDVTARNGKPFDDRLAIGAAVSGMQQTTGQDGGFLIPPAYSKDIWDGMNATPDNLLAMTDNFTVEGESLSFPANAETSRATGSRYGGVQGYWIAEGVQITKSAPKVRQLKIEPHPLAVLIYATDKLLGNATALEQYLTRAATDEINFLTGDAIINGTGAGKPKGILTSGALVTVSAETGQEATTIVAENISNMYARLHARSRASSVWLINQDIEPQLQFMTIGVGVGGQPVYMQPGQFSESPYARLYGRPVIPIEYCPTLGTVGDIILADMKGYVSGTKGGVETGMSIHLRFDYNETAFRFLFSVDGQTWLQSPITPYKGTGNTQSNFVVLASRT